MPEDSEQQRLGAVFLTASVWLVHDVRTVVHSLDESELRIRLADTFRRRQQRRRLSTNYPARSRDGPARSPAKADLIKWFGQLARAAQDALIRWWWPRGGDHLPLGNVSAE
jgi:hypothetical protein